MRQRLRVWKRVWLQALVPRGWSQLWNLPGDAWLAVAARVSEIHHRQELAAWRAGCVAVRGPLQVVSSLWPPWARLLVVLRRPLLLIVWEAFVGDVQQSAVSMSTMMV